MSAPLADPSVRAALEKIVELPAAGDAQALRRDAVRAVARLVPCELVCWYDFDPASGRVAVTSEPPGAGVALGAAHARAATASPTRVVTLAVPDARRVASVSVYRRGRDFDAAERALLAAARASVATAQRLLARRPSAPDRGALTAREAEVLDTLSAGYTPAQVGRVLGISRRTVHKHLEHAYRKLGVTHMGAATARRRAAGTSSIAAR